MVCMSAGGERSKNNHALTPGNLFSLEHLPNSRIVCTPHGRSAQFDRKMQIADLPTHGGCMCRIVA